MTKELRKKIIKLLITLLIFFLISIVSTIILLALNVIYFDDGLKLNAHLFDKFKTSWYGTLMIILFQVVVTSLLSFIPGTSMAFIILLETLYQNPLSAFLVSFSAVILSSISMYLLGRYGGYNICKKMIGEEDCKKASDLLNGSGKIYFPIMMLFPVFPDDALVMIAGTLKMSLNWFIPSIVIGRGIGVATIIFGLSIIPFDKFTSIFHWIVFILLSAICIVIVFLLANKLNKHLNKNENK